MTGPSPFAVALAVVSLAATVAFFVTIPKVQRKPVPLGLMILAGICGTIVVAAALISQYYRGAL